MGHLWSVNPAFDENYGGLVMWIPGSMMFAVTAIFMIYRWGRQEERTANRRKGETITAAEFRSRCQAANRRMAIGLICFVATVLTLTYSTVLIYRYAGTLSRAMGF
jgi:putative membrane protein